MWARALNGVGVLTLQQGDFAASRAFYEESPGHSRQLQDKMAMAYALNSLGLLAEK